MKTKNLVITALIVTTILSLTYQFGHSPVAQAKSSDNMQIGVVSLVKILQQSKRSASFKEKAAAEQDMAVAELNKLKADIEADRAGLEALKKDSPDRRELMKEVYSKSANYEAQQKFYEQEFALKNKQWIRKLYQDVIEATNKIAEARGLAMVFEMDEPDFENTSIDELMLTHKVLYAGGAVDLTEAVMEKIDTMD